VRNRRDGSVEILAAGQVHAIERLVEAAHKGPPFSRVAQVEVEAAEAEPSPDFVRRPTV
jgi:acylphosphatase